MNDAHLQYLVSPEWQHTIQTVLLPWMLEDVNLAEHLLVKP